MRVSIVIAILDSHEIVRRQILHLERMNLPDNVEVIFVDDGSNPPLYVNGHSLPHLTLHRTNDFRPWTQPLARNAGARLARGEYLLCTDIDHIITWELILSVLSSEYDYIRFKREAAVLDIYGNLTQAPDALVAYNFNRDKLRLPAHGNSYAIRRDLFLQLGGSRQKDHYPNQDEAPLKRQLKRLYSEGKVSIMPDDDRPTIYMIPNGRFCGDPNYNPFGLFHGLKR